MPTKKQKGNYYQKRTKDWFIKEGYAVYIMENKRSIYLPKTGTVLYQTYDIAGSDLMAMNGEEIIFIQVKSNASDINKGMKELNAHPYPDFVKKIVVLWELRSREPNIYDA